MTTAAPTPDDGKALRQQASMSSDQASTIFPNRAFATGSQLRDVPRSVLDRTLDPSGS